MLKNNRKLRGVVTSLLAGFFYGVAAVLTKVGVADFTSPFVGAAIAFLAGLVIMLPASARGVKAAVTGQRRDIIYVLASGVLAAGGIISYYAAFTTTPVAVVTSITSANPLVTILLANLFFQGVERISPRIIMGAVLVVGGVVLVTLGRNVA